MKCLILIIAGLFEMEWSIGLKYSQGFTKTKIFKGSNRVAFEKAL